METADDDLPQGRSSEKIARDCKVGGMLGFIILFCLSLYIGWRIGIYVKDMM